MNPVTISLIALTISVASFIFALFQFNRNQNLKKLERISEIMNKAFELRRASQKLKHLVEMTDDIDSHEEAIDVINTLCENVSKVLNNPKTTLSEVYVVEQKILKITLNFDLLSMQINEQIRFNTECAEFDRKQNAS